MFSWIEVVIFEPVLSKCAYGAFHTIGGLILFPFHFLGNI